MWGAAIMGQGLSSQHQAAFRAGERHREALERLQNSRRTTEAGSQRNGQIGGVPAASQAETEAGQPEGRAPRGINRVIAPSGPLDPIPVSTTAAARGRPQVAGGGDGRPIGGSSDRAFPSSVTTPHGTETGIIAGTSRRAGLRAPRLRSASGPPVGPDHLDAYVGRQAGISNVHRGEGKEYVSVYIESLNSLGTLLREVSKCIIGEQSHAYDSV